MRRNIRFTYVIASPAKRGEAIYTKLNRLLRSLCSPIWLVSAVLMVATVSVLLFEVGLLTRAQEGDATSKAEIVESGDVSSKCVIAMASIVDAEHQKLGKFMTEHFQSKKSTSELIPVAMERFRQYRKDIRSKMEGMLTPSSKVTAEAALAERPGCESFISEDFMLITNVIYSHILANAYAKKSTRLLDKYKIINAKLDKLNFTIAQMAGYFGAFSQKLPCYATKCTKG